MPPIFIITGTPGAGKSAVATALMQRFATGIHIPVDNLREWVVSGIAPPVPVWTAETSRQFLIARQAVAAVAACYAAAGFAVAIDDVIGAEEADVLIAEPLAAYPVYRVLLRPTLEITLQRNMQRTHKPFDHSILIEPIQHLYDLLDPAPFAAAGWLILDTSHLTLAATVDAIHAQPNP